MKLTLAKFDCLFSVLSDRFSTSIRDIAPPPLSVGCSFSSMLVVNLFDSFSAFGESLSRNDFDSVDGFVLMIGCALASEVILWMTRTPRRTNDRRLKRSSTWSAEREERKRKTHIYRRWLVIGNGKRMCSTKIQFTQMHANIVTRSNWSSCVSFCWH